MVTLHTRAQFEPRAEHRLLGDFALFFRHSQTKVGGRILKGVMRRRMMMKRLKRETKIYAKNKNEEYENGKRRK